MVYGATGYTGRLVVERALSRGHRPVLAGRDPQAVASVAAASGLPHRVFPLTDDAAVRAALRDVDVVASCAGPFSATAAALLDGCLGSGTSYVDVTGEIDVLEAVLARSAEVRTAGVTALPGSGFDVVPTDCLAAMVVAALPDARALDIAFVAGGGPSRGTARTALEGLRLGTRARVDGRIATLPRMRRRTAVFPSGPTTVTAVPWGDVSTAYHSTGVGDVVTYTRLPTSRAADAGRRLAAGVLRMPGARAALTTLVDRRVRGPDVERRSGSRCEVWVEARDHEGRRMSGSLTTPNGYDLTADSVVRVVDRVLAGAVPPGAHTPSQAHGPGFVLELDGVELHHLDDPGPEDDDG